MSQKMTSMAVWALALLGVVGCTTTPSRVEQDVRAASLDPALVGTWVLSAGEGSQVMTLADDGSFTHETIDGTFSGTYEAAAGLLTTDGVTPDGFHSITSYTYHANGSVLGAYALLPDGAHTGLVGVWSFYEENQAWVASGTQVSDYSVFETLELRDDGTFFSLGWLGHSVSCEGEYVEIAPGVVVLTGKVYAGGLGGNDTRTLYFVDGASLVSPASRFTISP